MLNGLGNLGNIMKLQKEMKNLQKQLKRNETSAASSDGMITAVVNGEFEVRSIKVDPEKIGSSTPTQIEKSITEAVNSAVLENKKLSAEKMKELTGGMDLGALGNMF